MKLEIWNLAIDFADDVQLLTKGFPKDELFILTSQFKKAADSIVLNISEGSIGHSDTEQERFLQYSLRSVAECVSCLYLSKKRNYISQDEFLRFYNKAELIFAKIAKFKNYLRKGKQGS